MFQLRVVPLGFLGKYRLLCGPIFFRHVGECLEVFFNGGAGAFAVAGGEDKVGRVDYAEHGNDEEKQSEGGSEADLLSHLRPTWWLFVGFFNLLDILASHGGEGGGN